MASAELRKLKANSEAREEKAKKKKGPIEATEAKKLFASGCPHYIICMMPASLLYSLFLGVTRQSLFVGVFLCTRQYYSPYLFKAEWSLGYCCNLT